MALPRRRRNSARQGKKRTHKKINPPIFSECSHCHQRKLPHQICPNCGYYKGRKVIEVTT